MTHSTRPRVAFAALLLAACPPAPAQEEHLPPPSGGLAGLIVGSGRQYLGSDEHRTMVLPMLEYRWSNGWFAGARGVGYRLVADRRVEFGLALGWDGGRKEHRSPRLRGMGDIDARPEATAFAQWQFAQDWSLEGGMRYGAGEHRDGLQLNLGVAWGTELAPRWRLGVKLGADFANRSHQQDDFGVTAEQAARSGYAAYAPGAGLRSVGLGLSLSHPLDADWMLRLGVEQLRLQGDAKASPLVREANPVTGSLSLSRRF